MRVRSRFLSASFVALAALGLAACGESTTAPDLTPLDVRVHADTIVAALNDWGPSRTVSFVTTIELTNRSTTEVVEYSVCGSIALHRGSGEPAYGLVCPAVALPPLVLGPGETTTLDLAHQLCVDGVCGDGRPIEELEGRYEMRVEYAVFTSTFAERSLLDAQVTSRSNTFVVRAQ
jgi:hypothetical protein